MSLTAVLNTEALTDDPNPEPLTLRIDAWRQDHFTRFGYDPRSDYCERFWLGVVGPACLWLARNVAYGLEASPDGYDIDLSIQADLVGLGRPSLRRCFARLTSFGLAQVVDNNNWAVRTHWAPVSPGALSRMPDALRRSHDDWDAIGADEGDARALWRFTVRMHAKGMTLPEIDTVLRQSNCDQSLRIELVEWAKATPRYGMKKAPRCA